MSNLIERMNTLRKENNLNQIDIANVANISLRTYQRYECGEREASLSFLISLADYYGCSIDFLIGRTDKPEVNK